MTYTEFKKLARRGGAVRWTTSGIVEIIVSRASGFWAINPASRREHRVFNRDSEGKIRSTWYCEEIDLSKEHVNLADFFDAMRSGEPLKLDGTGG